MLDTSNSAWWDSPSFSASTNASDTAIIEMPRIMLLQTFAACPAPASPQRTMRLPMPCRIGSAWANAACVPPAMKVSVPAVAPPTPPDTGASMLAIPACAAAAWAACAAGTSMVEQSMNKAPLAAAGRMSA